MKWNWHPFYQNAEYLAQEQTRDSADHNARLIFDPMIEYAESKIGGETA